MAAVGLREKRTLRTSQSSSPHLPRPWLVTPVEAGGWQGVQRRLSGLANQQPLQTLPGDLSTSGIQVLEIPICDILNYWCQTPQPPLLMVFLATAFNLSVHSGHAEFTVYSKFMSELMLTVKCQAAPCHPGLSYPCSILSLRPSRAAELGKVKSLLKHILPLWSYIFSPGMLLCKKSLQTRILKGNQFSHFLSGCSALEVHGQHLKYRGC